jgi:hypothetical protein
MDNLLKAISGDIWRIFGLFIFVASIVGFIWSSIYHLTRKSNNHDRAKIKSAQANISSNRMVK